MAENKIELAKAYVQVIPTTEGIKDNLTKALEPESEEAGKKSGSTFMQKFGHTMGGMAKVAAAGVAAAAVVVGKTLKASIEEFADYEQLKGGIETLFKDSSDTMMKYAQDAYKTTGLSANQYMDTVTSFSAALLNSVGGDTEEAARIANQTMIDMSDVANKMGVSIESVQSAYSGFAKGQYMLLDNLKLGYSGTKEGMEQLLKDAQAISGVEYNIDSFADIASAINVIQTQMGITGTTAEEASTTISGSLNQVKAAWSNVLVGMISGDQDIKTLVGNLTESLKSLMDNLVPAIIEGLKGISALVTELAPVLIEELPIFIDAVLPDLISTAVDLALNVVSALIEALPQIIETLLTGVLSAENINKIVEGFFELINMVMSNWYDIITPIIAALPEIISNVVSAIISNLPILIEGCVNLVIGLVENLPTILYALMVAIPEIVTAIVNAFLSPESIKKWISIGTEAVTKIKESFSELPGKLKEKFEEAKEKWSETWDNIKEKCAPIIDNIRDKFKELKGKLKEVGKDIVKGLWNGINSKVDWIKEKIGGWCKKIGGAIKDFFGIASPSKLMAEYGKYIDEGLATGIEKNSSIATNAMKELGEDALGGINVNGVVQSNVMAASATPSIASDRKLDQIEALLKKIAEGSDVYIDGNKLVGQTANRMEKALSDINYSRQRGVTVYGY